MYKVLKIRERLLKEIANAITITTVGRIRFSENIYLRSINKVFCRSMIKSIISVNAAASRDAGLN